MNQLIKMANINKYLTAIKIANALRTTTYAAVIALALFNIFRVYKTVMK